MRKPSNRFIRSALEMLILSSHVAVPPVSAVLGFEPWEDEVFVAIGKDYGAKAEKRLRRIMESIFANHDRPVM